MRWLVGLVLVLVLACAPAFAAADPPACRPDARFDKPKASDRDTRDLDKGMLGKTPTDVLAKRGQPGCRSAALWRYRIPNYCSDWKTVVSVWFKGKAGKQRVSRVTAVRYYTGEHCADFE